MKKFILILVAALTTLTMSAQNQCNYTGSSSFWDNWSIGVGGGVQTNGHDWNAPQGAVVTFTLDKEITPLFTLGAEVGTGFNNDANWICGNLLDGTRHSQISHPNGTAIENLSAFVNGSVNLTNAIWGYNNKPRFFEVGAGAGVGYMHWYDNIPNSGADFLVNKAFVNFDFNFDKKRAWTARLTPAFIWNTSVTGAYDIHYSVGQLTASIIYNFNTSNGNHYAIKPVLYDYDEVDRLNEKINKLKSALAKKPREVTCYTEKTVIDTIDNSYTVYFEQGSSDVGDITEIAHLVNKTNDVITIVGGASPEGSEAINKKLALDRANAVKNALVAAGVDASRISTSADYDKLRKATIVLGN